MRLARQLPPLDTLISFEAVARCGSFTVAANELCLTQSAVSKQIRALEDSLQLALFVRHARGIELSDAGRELLAEIQPMLYGLVRTIERLKQAHDATAVTVTLTFNAALEGLGIALGWDFMVAEPIEQGRLRQVGAFVYQTGRHDYLVCEKHRPLSPAAQIFRDWLVDSVAG